jgi:hypothetical protein
VVTSSKLNAFKGLKWITYYVCGLICGGIVILALVEKGFGDKRALGSPTTE